MKARGYSPSQITEETGLSGSYINSLISSYNTRGIGAISGKHYQVVDTSYEVETKFLDPFVKRSQAGEKVTVREVREAYQAFSGYEMSYAQVYQRLKRHGWVSSAAQRKKLEDNHHD